MAEMLKNITTVGLVLFVGDTWGFLREDTGRDKREGGCRKLSDWEELHLKWMVRNWRQPDRLCFEKCGRFKLRKYFSSSDRVPGAST